MPEAQQDHWEVLQEKYEKTGIECVKLKAENSMLKEKLSACERKLKEIRTLLEEKERVIITLQSEREP